MFHTQNTKLRKALRFVAFLILIALNLAPIMPVFAQEATNTPAAPQVTDSTSTPPETSSSSGDGAFSNTEIGGDFLNNGSGDDQNDSSQEGISQDNSSQTSSLLSGSSNAPTVSNSDLFTYKTIAPSVDKNSGALIQSVPLSIPPGRNNLQPNLELDYNSQNLDDSNLAGYGWSISIPYIQRMNKTGTDKLYTDNYFTSSADGELATSSTTGTYYPRIDGGNFTKYIFANNAWIAYDKNGTQYKYGSTTQAQQYDTSTSTGKVYKWMLEQVSDRNGNTIQYTYSKDNNQIYPSQITYTGTATTTGTMSIIFATSTRPDSATTYQPAFKVQTNYRISQIDAKVNGSLVRRYAFSYGIGDNGNRSLLTSVQETGQDANGAQLTLPAITFQYSSSNVGWHGETLGYHSDQAYVATQMQGNGINDSVLANNNSFSGCGNTSIWVVDGSQISSPPPYAWACPASPQSQVIETGSRLIDISGNGFASLAHYNQNADNPDLYMNISSSSGLYTFAQVSSANFNGVIPPFAVYDGTASYSTGLFGNLNGNGYPSFVEAFPSGAGLVASSSYIGNGSAWVPNNNFAAIQTFPGPSSSNVSNSRLIDVNGDGLDDWMYSDASNTYTCLNNGTGWDCAAGSSWTIATSTYYGASHLERGIRFVDINGDGLPDMIRSYYNNNGSNGYEVGDIKSAWLNTGHGFATTTSSFSINNTYVFYYFTPSIGVVTNTFEEYVDWNGDGLPDILNNRNTGKKPDLLTQINYPKGGNEQVSYVASPQTGTNSNLPFPLYVVSQKITNDNEGNSTQIDYTYTGGKLYFTTGAPQDKKFAGFYTVTETHPDYIVKTYFNQGDGTSTTSSTDGELTDSYSQIGDPFRVDIMNTSSSIIKKTLNTWNSTTQGNTTFNILAEQKIQDFAPDSSHQDKVTDYTYSPSNGDLLQADEYGGTLNYTHPRRTSYTYAASSTINLSVLVEKKELDTTLSSTTANASGTISYLIIGAGGGGGSGFFFGPGGGGGGAGGLLSGTTTVSTQSYTINVGSGGAGGAASTGSSNYGSNGGNSSAFSVTATGGGGGAAGNGAQGNAGGSGGGSNYSGTNVFGGSGTVGQGNDGGRASVANNGTGGGGFSSQGSWTSNGSGSGTNGGTSATSSITGSVVSYAGGGGGGAGQSGTSGGAGQAGGGNGGFWNGSVPTNGTAATANTGSGGGGGGGGQVSGSTGTAGGAGADGVVIVSATAGTISSATGGTKTTSGGNDIWTFTSSGTWTIPSIVTIVASSTVLADELYYYDNLAFGSVSTGNQTKVADWITGTTYASSTKTYNSYGLVSSAIDPRGNVTRYSYDSLNFYPASTTNPLGQTTSAQYDYATGNVATSTDPNGLVTANVFDPVGRITQQKGPDSVNGSTTVIKKTVSYTDNTFPSYTINVNYLNSASTTTGYEYFDGLGRTIQTRTQAPQTNTYVVKDKIYNNTSMLFRESLPYFASSTSWVTPTTTSSLYASYAYDPLHRPSTIATVVGTTSYSYLPWHTITTDQNGNLKDLWTDLRGNLINVVEHSTSTNSATTTYAYDPIDNLTKVADASGNVRNFTYDGLKRRLTAEDLHAVGDSTFGTSTYAYDLAGNMTQKIDPKGQTVNYTYDALNRQLTEDYTGQSGIEIAYTYDSCANGTGYLCSVSTAANTTTYTYNPLGLKSSEVETIVGTSTNFTTTYRYDLQGNQTYITYPDNGLVQYLYNSAGQVSSVYEREGTFGAATSTIVSQFSYAPTGDIASIQYGNGSLTTNTYDQNNLYRLTAKQSFGASTTTIAQNGPLQILVVAGGGGGAGGNNGQYGGGGGGAGGVVASSTYKIATGTYTITVGAGGAAGSFTPTNGSTGSNSSIGSLITAIGGGYGGAGVYISGNTFGTNGGDGGSGGGGGSGSSAAGVGGNASSSQGYAGGTGLVSVQEGSGGGGGAGGLGTNGYSNVYGSNGGFGGPGVLSSITGTDTYYGGGGGGGGNVFLTLNGGIGGGGSGDYHACGGNAGTPNTGGGGGGGACDNGGAGGSGVVIIRYPTVNAPDYTCGSGTTTISGVDTVCTFTSNGTFTVTNSFGSTTRLAKLQDIHYIYDPNGNIISRADNSDIANGQSTAYVYDGLNRLNTASTTISGFGSYKQAYTYDALGNITNGPLGAYGYTGNTGFNYANPDALTILGVTGSTTSSISTSTIALDATSTNYTIGSNGTTTKTWTHTISGTNPVIVLAADLIQTTAGSASIGSVSWNGGAFTKATSTVMSNADAEVWYLVATSTGAKTISVTINGTTDAIRLGASSFTGVSTSSTFDLVKTNKSSGGNPSISITPTTNTDVVISTLSKTGGGAGSGGGGGSSTSTPALVQSGVNHSSAVTLGSSVTTGNTIVVGVTNFGAVSTVTDNKGNTYTKVADAKNGTDHAAIYYAKNVTGGSSFTITSTAGGTIAAHEYSGLSTTSPSDKVASSTGTGTVLSSGSVTVGNDNEVYFGLGWSDGNGNTWTAGSGYTLRQQETDNNTWERLATEDAIITTASTSVARITASASNPWAAALATFRPSTTGGGGGTATTSADATTSQTALYKDFATSTFGGASYKVATASGAITDTYTTATSTNWAMAAIALRPATTTTISGGGITGTTTLTYDKNGNQTNDGAYIYSWDYRNRLASSSNGTATSTYAYDQNNNRVSLTESGNTTLFPNTLYSLALGTGATTTKRIYVNNILISTIEGTASTTATTTGSGGGGGGTSTSTPALVQSTHNSTTGTATFTNPVTAGNTVIVGVTIWNTAVPSNAITDTKGNIYTKVGEAINTTSTDHIALFYATNVTGGSSFAVTSSVGGTIALHEYSGISTTSPLDRVASSTGLTGNLSSSNITTSIGNELYVGLAWSNGSGDTWGSSGGYTLREQETDNNTNERMATEDQVISSATTTQALFTVTTNNYWAALIASFKPATFGGGGGGTGTTTTTTTTSGSTTIRYIIPDHLGGTNIVLDQSANVVEALDYYPYGQIRSDNKYNYGGEKFKYAQTQYDAGTSLDYAQNRYQSPTRGQFISEDPVFWSPSQNLLDPQSLNSYSYANNNPVNLKDSTGMSADAASANQFFQAAPLLGVYGFPVAGTAIGGAAAFSLLTLIAIQHSTWSDQSSTPPIMIPDQNGTYRSQGNPVPDPSNFQNPEPNPKPGTSLWKLLFYTGLTAGGAYGVDHLDQRNSIGESGLNFVSRASGNNTNPQTLSSLFQALGTNSTNIFSSSVQSRTGAVNSYNSTLSATGQTSSGGAPVPNSSTLYVTPNGAIVSAGGQLVSNAPKH